VVSFPIATLQEFNYLLPESDICQKKKLLLVKICALGSIAFANNYLEIIKNQEHEKQKNNLPFYR
jgi:hypothetical protein